MQVKSQPKNNFFCGVNFGGVVFGRVVFWSSCLLVELVLANLTWSSCRLVEFLFGRVVRH
jgi:hypothetical protein